MRHRPKRPSGGHRPFRRTCDRKPRPPPRTARWRRACPRIRAAPPRLAPARACPHQCRRAVEAARGFRTPCPRAAFDGARCACARPRPPKASSPDTASRHGASGRSRRIAAPRRRFCRCPPRQGPKSRTPSLGLSDPSSLPSSHRHRQLRQVLIRFDPRRGEGPRIPIHRQTEVDQRKQRHGPRALAQMKAGMDRRFQI